MKVYTFGYEKRQPEELLAEAERLNAVVVDVRIKPFSRAKGWSQKALAELLGDRYRWVREFGNENYQGGPVQLVDVDVGVERVRTSIAVGCPLILLCYEADPGGCHRTVVAGLLARRFGLEVEHLVKADTSPRQPPLF